jgi:hypothetical protein
MNDNSATPSMSTPRRNVTAGDEAQPSSSSAPPPSAAQPESTSTQTQNLHNAFLYLRGAEVEFGDGGAVINVSLPSDFSAARFTGLPRGTTPDSVRDLLLVDGILTSPDNIPR